MATWSEVKSFIKSRYPQTQDDGKSLSIVLQLEDNRSQMMFVGFVDVDGDSMDCVMFLAPFARQNQISAAQALAKSSGPFGLATIGDDFYALKHSAFIADVDENEIIVPLELLSRLADQAERSLGLGDSL